MFYLAKPHTLTHRYTASSVDGTPGGVNPTMTSGAAPFPPEMHTASLETAALAVSASLSAAPRALMPAQMTSYPAYGRSSVLHEEMAEVTDDTINFNKLTSSNKSIRKNQNVHN